MIDPQGLPRIGTWSPPALPEDAWLRMMEEVLPVLSATGTGPGAALQNGLIADRGDGVYTFTSAGLAWIESIRAGEETEEVTGQAIGTTDFTALEKFATGFGAAATKTWEGLKGLVSGAAGGAAENAAKVVWPIAIALGAVALLWVSSRKGAKG